MKIIFIGHLKHVTTKSSQFFLDIFSDHQIDKFFFDDKNAKQVIDKIQPDKYDLAICWQYDFMVPFFQSYNIPTVAVPMYDGSFGHRKEHWINISKARHVNFSQTLHFKSSNFGAVSLFNQYYLNPDLFSQVSFDGSLNGFLWQRRPKEINYLNCMDYFNNYKVLDSLILHTYPDFEDDKTLYIPSDNFCKDNNITILHGYQEDKSVIDNHLQKSNIYFAPRVTEGIGMGFLEALTRGMCVVALDQPTHNEYIVDGINGFLADNNTKCMKFVDNFSKRARECGLRARENCFIGYSKWLKSIPQLKDFVLSTPKSNKYTSVLHRNFTKKLAISFFKYSRYKKYSRLLRMLNRIAI